VADEVQIRFGADLGGAIAAVDQLKRAVSGVTEPVSRLKSAFAEAGTASTATLAAFRANLQRMVAEHSISLHQAIGYDIEYTAQRSAQERERLTSALANDAATLADRTSNHAELVGLSERYATRLAQGQRRIAEAARREADRIALPYRQAFDEIGAGWRAAVTGLVEGTLTFGGAALQVAQSVESGFIGMLQTTASRATAGPLGRTISRACSKAGLAPEKLGRAQPRAADGTMPPPAKASSPPRKSNSPKPTTARPTARRSSAGSPG
jgi:hypothetical protein